MSAELTVTLPDPRQKKRYYLQMTPVRRVMTPTLAAVFRLFATLEASGGENLPESGGVILAANHLTNFDVLPMQFSLARPVFFMGKAELFRNPLIDWLFRQLGGFPVYRGERDAWAVQHAERVLKSGQVLGIFPEGTRSKGKGLRTGKTGAAHLALNLGCPIVPMAVDGTQHIFRPAFRRAKVKITAGEPLFPLADESPIELTDRLMFTIASMLPPAARGVYAYRPEWF